MAFRLMEDRKTYVLEMPSESKFFEKVKMLFSRVKSKLYDLLPQNCNKITSLCLNIEQSALVTVGQCVDVDNYFITLAKKHVVSLNEISVVLKTNILNQSQKLTVNECIAIYKEVISSMDIINTAVEIKLKGVVTDLSSMFLSIVFKELAPAIDLVINYVNLQLDDSISTITKMSKIWKRFHNKGYLHSYSEGKITAINDFIVKGLSLAVLQSSILGNMEVAVFKSLRDGCSFQVEQSSNLTINFSITDSIKASFNRFLDDMRVSIYIGNDHQEDKINSLVERYVDNFTNIHDQIIHYNADSNDLYLTNTVEIFSKSVLKMWNQSCEYSFSTE